MSDLISDPTNDLISRQDAIRVASGFCHPANIAKELERLPSAEPEIIQCKDCVHCADDWNGAQPMFTCELGSCGESVYPNYYCSLAERRSDG